MVALRGILAATVLGMALLGGCSRDAGTPSKSGTATDRTGTVTVQGDDRIAESLTWQAPAVELPAGGRKVALAKAAAALAAGHLYDDGDAAIPLYMALVRQEPGDVIARNGLRHALDVLLASGDGFLATSGDDIEALRSAHRVAAVARTAAPEDDAVRDYLHRVDTADQLWELNRQAEEDLRAGRLGESGKGALTKLRAALRLQPGQSRASQGLAAVESGLIRRAEDAARKEDFASASRWLAVASAVRHDAGTIADARARIAVIRSVRVDQLHDEGMQALLQPKGIALARGKLTQMLRIADPADGAVAELRQRIDQVTHYGQFRAGQHFTDGLKLGARSPEMVVVPHGGFRMGAADEDDEAGDVEKPAHYVRFARGFAMSRTEVTVDQFRDFIRSSGYRTTATRRGQAMVYDERSGNFVRRGGVDWQSAYDGSRADGSLPVVFVSARDAQAYVEWLAAQSSQRYRLPSEAEFEYALRAGSSGRYPWGNGSPSPGTDNIAGAKDTSPGGRRWSNAYAGYGDGFWGPAPVGHFGANAYDLHDLAGNVSEWVADCWHDSYRRAPDDGAGWLNPGCRMGVVRGGSWASSPAQTRSAWRAPLDAEATNARIGFRVVREI
ncbi:formylglycine-generating enzyme family protein [Cognatiluteimonas profundi]|uniref:formylglycine-generating enzyme family protein n=1 Tax=Cognatiluteimonas profundi TaxID=2594501 RepID=UPI00131E3432